MFHGVMFSLKFSKQFYLSIDPIRKNKLENIIKILDLKKRIFYERIENEKIDFKKLHENLNPIIHTKQKILKENIENINKN